jgi:hypothetical protein
LMLQLNRVLPIINNSLVSQCSRLLNYQLLILVKIALRLFMNSFIARWWFDLRYRQIHCRCWSVNNLYGPQFWWHSYWIIKNTDVIYSIFSIL